MRILVTGGAGFIGSVTVKKLLDQNHQVTVFDCLENGHLEAVDKRAVLVVGDLRRIESLEQIISEGNFDAVIHFAGYIESGESMKDPLKFFENNFSGGLNLLKLLNKYGPKNIIFSSTAGVYGNGRPPYTEKSPIDTTSYYSMSKYFFERALESASLAYGFKVVVLRYFNAAGALKDGTLGEDHHPETHLIPLVIKTALGLKEELYLYGTDYPTIDGTAVRDYIHVEDLADTHVLSLNKFSNDNPFFEIYNVGAGKGYSNTQVIEMVRRVSGSDFKVIKRDRRSGDWASSFADVSKINKEFGWKAQYGLFEIVESAYLWHKNQSGLVFNDSKNG